MRIATLGMACALVTGAGHAQTTPPVQEAYTVEAKGISFQNTPNRKHIIVSGKTPLSLATLSVALARKSNVLVQFTSQLATVTKDGCPCSVRASLSVDGGEPIVIKRINLSAGSGDGTAYVPDRIALDGSFVFPLPAGKHQIVLTVQQLDGTAAQLYAFYPNMQVLTFAE